MARITDRDVDRVLIDTERALRERGVTGPVTLYRGSASYRETNKLIAGGTNLWPDGMAGFTAREAYNALRLMRASLGLIADAAEVRS